MARRQHVLIEEQGLLDVLRCYLGSLLSGEKLWPFSPATFANCLRRLLSHLGCPNLFLPAGLRAGGGVVDPRAVDELRWLLEVCGVGRRSRAGSGWPRGPLCAPPARTSEVVQQR